MALRLRSSPLLWGLFVALAVAALGLRLRVPGHPALPWVAGALLGFLAVRVGVLALDWRKGLVPGTRLLLPGILLAEGLGLTMTGASQWALAMRLGTALVLELALLGLAFRTLRRAWTVQARWPEDRIGAAFEAFVPPRAARIMALELVMLGSAFRFLFGGFRQPTPPGFSLHKETFLRSMLPVMPLLIPTDLFLIQVLFPGMSVGWRWFMHLSTLYAVVWMVGLYATLRQRPHQVDAVQVSLHMSLLGSMSFPRNWVVSATPLPEFDDDWAKRDHMKGMHTLLRTGAPAVELRLSEPVARTGILGPSPRLSNRVAVSVDDPAAFLAALGRPCA